MKTDCYNRSAFTKGFVAAVLLLLPVLSHTAQAQDLRQIWLDVGEMANRYSAEGAKGLGGGGNVWPYILGNTGSLSAYHDGEHVWMAIRDFTDDEGTTHPYWINYIGEEESHATKMSWTQEHRLVSRFAAPTVTVNDQPSERLANTIDEVDPSLQADRLVTSEVSTLSGITMRREIRAFSQQHHDNYHLIEYTFTNTGNTDGDADIERPDHAIEDVTFWLDRRWGMPREAAAVTARSSTWGKSMMHDVVRDGDVPMQYAWQGNVPEFTGSWDEVGAPAIEVLVENFASALPSEADTVGRLVGPGFTGRGYLHVDAGPGEATHDPEKLRSMTFWDAEDSTLFCGDGAEDVTRCYDPTNQTNNQLKFDSLITAGVMQPYHADLVEPDGDFAHPTGDPGLPEGRPGRGQAVAGFKEGAGFGPYTLAPGESVTIVVAEGVDGLSTKAAAQIGRRYKELWQEGNGDGDIAYDANGDGAITAEEQMSKNEWFWTGRDSLMQMRARAKANYEAGYALPQAPRPPEAFRVSGEEEAIQLEWELYADASDPAGGFAIYRGQERYQGTVPANYQYEQVASVEGSARSYEDTGVTAGVEYYYYIQAVGEENTDGTAMTPTGVRLRSSRYYTQTYDPVSIRGGGSAAAERFYMAPGGSDENDGLSADRPLQTFDAAVPRLAAGDTLVLLDGTYTTSQNGFFDANCNGSARSGTEQDPIVVMAQNERRAWIKGDGSDLPFWLRSCSWWNIEGLRVSSADNDDSDFFQGNAMRIQQATDIELRRLLIHNNNRYENGALLQIVLSQRVLVEESELYFFHRNGVGMFKSENVTVRRVYANSHGYEDISGGYGSHNISDDGGDAVAPPYYSSNSIVENSISEFKNEAFGIGISGFNTVTGGPSARNNKVLGSISLRDNKPGGFGGSRIKDETSRPSDNLLMEDYLIVNPIRRGMVSRASKHTTARNITAIGVPGTVIYLNGDRQVFRGSDGEPVTIWPECSEIGGCDFDISNVLFIDNEDPITAAGEGVDWVVESSNFWNSGASGLGEAVTDDEGNVRNSTTTEPTGIGLGEGECAVFIPESSNMSGAGKDGADIGANILYRYQDGELTDEELWNAETGEFPHGAVIEASPNDPDAYDRVAATVHRRLNVNTNGCMLPYATGTATSETGEVPDALRLRQNYPNPFNPATQIRFALPQAGRATLTVYDVLGREVATLVDRPMTAGEHQVRFEAGHLPSGLYLYRLEAGGRTRVQKMMLVR